MLRPEEIRVMHIIDSLSPGGSEQMAVNMANGLVAKHIHTSLLVTHGEGLLSEKLSAEVDLTILNKKSTFDFGAFRRMAKTIKNQKINVLHAHSSSIFWASAIKLFHPNIRLIWHDHYGNSEMVANRPGVALKMCAPLWFHVISVNEKLSVWAAERLSVPTRKITFLNNFAVLQKDDNEVTDFPEGLNRYINLVNVANLRPQKDHDNLLKAFEIIAETRKDVVLHLLGANPGNEYATALLEKIKTHRFADRIYYWGARKNVSAWLRSMQIGILASVSEGLPVSLLEYGMAGLQVVATNVGQVADVLDHGRLGRLVPSSAPVQLANAVMETISHKNDWPANCRDLQNFLNKNYSEDATINKLIQIYCA